MPLVAEESGNLAAAAKWGRKTLEILGAEYAPTHPVYAKRVRRIVESMAKLGHEAARAEFARLLTASQPDALANPVLKIGERGAVMPILEKKVEPTYSRKAP